MTGSEFICAGLPVLFNVLVAALPRCDIINGVNPKILIVDDEASVRESLQQALSRDFFVFTADSAKKAKEIWRKESLDIVLLDILLPDCSGISILEELRKDFPELPAIMITGTRHVKTAVQAMKLGAHDYITKPFSIKELNDAIHGALKSGMQKNNSIGLFKQAKENIFFENMVGRSRKMLEVYKRVAQVMHNSATVLIQGESGTGKELIAKAIHFHGIRRQKPFVPIHIASLSESLLESELFGHEKGAFTGAIQTKKGTLEEANGGTLFLDEVGEIPLPIQVKLLRVIQEREFRRVGGTKDIKIDVRLITATNKNLLQLVEKGVFREDLYYRISVVPINVPSLRERVEDIPVLAYHFLDKLRKKLNSKVQGFEKDTLELLKKYGWPGNIRELENFIEHLLHTVDQQWILPADVSAYISKEIEVKDTLEGTLSIYERKIIGDALTKSKGIVSKAADILGTTRRVLKYKIDKLKINSDD